MDGQLRFQIFHIIHQITFHAVNNLEEILVPAGVFTFPFASLFVAFPKVLPLMIGVRKGMDNPMIGDGHRWHSPFIGSANNFTHLADAIHIAGFRMAVQLHTLSLGGIFPGN